MIAGQINLLKERADAVAQLVHSLKTENTSLKENLLSAQSQIKTLLNEITRLKSENQILLSKNTFFTTERYPDHRDASPRFDRDMPQTEKIEHTETAGKPDTEQLNSEFSENPEYRPLRTEAEIPGKFHFSDVAVSESGDFVSESPDSFPTDKNNEYDPFFDAFSQYETVSDISDLYGNEFENSHAPAEEQPPTEFRRVSDRKTESATAQPYSQLDIFY